MRDWLIWDNHRSYEEWNYLVNECLTSYGKPTSLAGDKQHFLDGHEPIFGAIEIARSQGWHACRKRMEADATYKVEGKNDE